MLDIIKETHRIKNDPTKWLSCILCGKSLMEKDIRYIRSAIEDLADGKYNLESNAHTKWK